MYQVATKKIKSIFLVIVPQAITWEEISVWAELLVVALNSVSFLFIFSLNRIVIQSLEGILTKPDPGVQI